MGIPHYLSLVSETPVETTLERLIREIWFFLGKICLEVFHTFSHPSLQAGLALAAHTLPRSKCWHFLSPMAIFAARPRNKVPQLTCQFCL